MTEEEATLPTATPTEYIETDTAIAVIDTLLNFSMLTLGILAFLVALVGIWLSFGVYKTAKQIANSAVTNYIKSESFQKQLSETLDRAVADRMKNSIVVVAPTKSADDRPAFPETNGDPSAS